MVNLEQKLKNRKKKCPFDRANLEFRDSVLMDEFDSDGKKEVDRWVCPDCGARFEFEVELSDEEYGEMYRNRGNGKKLGKEKKEKLKTQVSK